MWEEVDPAWVPIAGLTLTFFQELLTTARTAQREERRMRVRRRRAGAALAVALSELWDLSVRWYDIATAVFADEESDGASVLRQIPTTYVPRYAEAAKQRRAARKAAAAGGGEPVP